MKLKISLLFLVLCVQLQAQVGIGTTNPNATLEINATNPNSPQPNDGILIPRVNNFPATNPGAGQHAMMIFLVNPQGSYPEGFYYWDANYQEWIPVSIDNDTTNEIQDLQLIDSNLGLSGSNQTVNMRRYMDLKFPDGFANIIPVENAITYTVPQGKNLYITSGSNITFSIVINNSINSLYHTESEFANTNLLPSPIIVKSGDTASTGGSANFNGFIVDATVTPVHIYEGNIYTVPANKILVIIGAHKHSATIGYLKKILANNYQQEVYSKKYLQEFNNPIFFDAGSKLITTGLRIWGYLMDK